MSEVGPDAYPGAVPQVVAVAKRHERSSWHLSSLPASRLRDLRRGSSRRWPAGGALRGTTTGRESLGLPSRALRCGTRRLHCPASSWNESRLARVEIRLDSSTGCEAVSRRFPLGPERSWGCLISVRSRRLGLGLLGGRCLGPRGSRDAGRGKDQQCKERPAGGPLPGSVYPGGGFYPVWMAGHVAPPFSLARRVAFDASTRSCWLDLCVRPTPKSSTWRWLP